MVSLCPATCLKLIDWKLTAAAGVEMANLKENDVRALFQAMHDPSASTNKLASTGRGNSAEPYNGDGFLSEFEAMLDTNFEIATEVFKKFGA
tara:strand:- start:1530 stop:1805 length:276 start_codon:yes stop_codon:yes gene_type:complete